MTAHEHEQKLDEQVYRRNENRSDELPEDPTPDYDEVSEESFPASDPPAMTPGIPEPPERGSSR